MSIMTTNLKPQRFVAWIILAGVLFGAGLSLSTFVLAQSGSEEFPPVTSEMLLNPADSDWIHFRRTYDSWAYSPLTSINRENVGNLQLAWGWAMEPGQQETTPLVYNGIMYLASPGSVVQALDAASGELLWEYKRDLPRDIAPGAPNRGFA